MVHLKLLGCNYFFTTFLIRYKLVDDAGGRFIIQSDMFGINKLFTTDILLDYENVSIHNISIKATDNGNPPGSVTSTITVQVSEWSIFFVTNLVQAISNVNQLHSNLNIQ